MDSKNFRSKKEEEEEKENAIRRLLHVVRIDTRILEAKKETEIGSMFNDILYHRVLDDGAKTMSEIELDAVIGLMGHIEYRFAEADLREEDFPYLIDRLERYINAYSNCCNPSSFVIMNCKRTHPLQIFLKRTCYSVKDKEIFEYDEARDKIVSCNDKFVISYLKEVLKWYNRLDHLKNRLTGVVRPAEPEHPKFDSKEYAKEKVPCGCGVLYTRSNKKHHEETKRHTDWVDLGCPYREVKERSKSDGGSDTEDAEPVETIENNADIIVCGCGESYIRCNKSHHELSPFHVGYLRAINNQLGR